MEKEDLVFDVSEILNPYEISLRIKIFDKYSLKMVSVSEIKETELKQELTKDKMSYLVEPHRREELSKYLVQNTFSDQTKKRISFLKSSIDI